MTSAKLSALPAGAQPRCTYECLGMVAVVLDLPDEDPWTICEHVAVPPRVLARMLAVAGRPDLAAPFRAAAAERMRVPDLVAAEVEALAGSSVREVCAALGRTPATIARALHRAGRHDLAHRFDREAWAQRRASRTGAAA